MDPLKVENNVRFAYKYSFCKSKMKSIDFYSSFYDKQYDIQISNEVIILSIYAYTRILIIDSFIDFRV